MNLIGWGTSGGFKKECISDFQVTEKVYLWFKNYIYVI